MKKSKPLSREEKEKILAMLDDGYPATAIARVMKRSVRTVRELRKNPPKPVYRPKQPEVAAPPPLVCDQCKALLAACKCGFWDLMLKEHLEWEELLLGSCTATAENSLNQETPQIVAENFSHQPTAPPKSSSVRGARPA